MIVHRLCTPPSVQVASALARFEAQFSYPLGPGRSFRIAHGADYARFFRAIGEASCFVSERQGRVLGTIGVALRDLLLPNGEERRVVYLGDLKVDPEARSGYTLLRLAEAVRDWVGQRAQAAFAVVMDGTSITPDRYTGRLGMLQFRELGKIIALRLSTEGHQVAPEVDLSAAADSGAASYRLLSAGRYANPGGHPEERSEMRPMWLGDPGGNACGRLEDSRKAKRLFSNNGAEIVSAHLSCFAFRDVRAGARLLRIALGIAGSAGVPALFTAVSVSEAAAFCQALPGVEFISAPATVYGVGLEPGPLWNINTAEI